MSFYCVANGSFHQGNEELFPTSKNSQCTAISAYALVWKALDRGKYVVVLDTQNSEQVREANRRYVERNPKISVDARHKYHELHPEVHRKAVSPYSQQHPDDNRSSVRHYSQLHPEVNRDAVLRYSQQHPDVNRSAV
ncbi:hypothetical protein J6590_091295 [Homalodisca vitripennis]|nr:hypothetical protein J6590_091295 [Homalodisca vitripennis]